MKRRDLISEDSGTVAVDWIVLVASVVLACSMVTSTVSTGLQEVSLSISEQFVKTARRVEPQHRYSIPDLEYSGEDPASSQKPYSHGRSRSIGEQNALVTETPTSRLYDTKTASNQAAKLEDKTERRAASTSTVASQTADDDQTLGAPVVVALAFVFSGSIWAVRYGENWTDCSAPHSTKRFDIQGVQDWACLEDLRLSGVTF